jgi:hypothetical protein
MELEEQEGWLLVRMSAEEMPTDLDWDGFVRWKVPEAERVYVPDLGTWIVRVEHRTLIERLYEIYRLIGTAGMDTEALREVQALIDKVEEQHPGADLSPKGQFRAWLKGIGLN